jgi:lipopolysaccharide transport system ATP-binding protein
MTPIIEINGISKKYVISHQRNAAYGSLRDDIANLLRRPFQPHITQGASRETVWALDNVSFDVQQGEIIGIIGSNGSGKSTLLKILSRITDPTKGSAVLRGRTSSLLEVGTGFHPQLTGRENIFLNGAILGMTKKEVTRKFDEIVDFSNVERYIDTPVKFYSSGMYVRLAFSVAAHLEPDILIIDEVLAVGDAEFQRKSLGKMHAVAREGRTVLFVSHNMQSVRELCDSAFQLAHGVIVNQGDTATVTDAYLGQTEYLHKTPIRERRDREGTGRLTFSDVAVEDAFLQQRALSFDLSIDNHTSDTYDNVLVSVVIEDNAGRSITNVVSYNVGYSQTVNRSGARLRIGLTNLNLVPGTYYLNVFLSSDTANSEIFDWVKHAAAIVIPEYDYYRNDRLPIMKGGTTLYTDCVFDDITASA